MMLADNRTGIAWPLPGVFLTTEASTEAIPT
jgi:hypothetical protein